MSITHLYKPYIKELPYNIAQCKFTLLCMLFEMFLQIPTENKINMPSETNVSIYQQYILGRRNICHASPKQFWFLAIGKFQVWTPSCNNLSALNYTKVKWLQSVEKHEVPCSDICFNLAFEHSNCNSFIKKFPFVSYALFYTLSNEFFIKYSW